ncbi:hypothetical protein, partial [Mycobacterium tuberculosis]
PLDAVVTRWTRSTTVIDPTQVVS